jgi:Spy/CpxP family protein refolding chaperone
MVYAERRVQHMARELHLTPEQEKSLHDIFKTAHQRASQVNEEVAWDLADIHRDSVKAIQELLTPEQRAQFDKMHHRYHLQHHHMPNEDVEVSTAAEANARRRFHGERRQPIGAPEGE